MSTRRILVLGSSGYIGGSILTRFLQSTDANIKLYSFSALIRDEKQAARLKEKNVTPVLFSGLEDTDFLRKQASEYDIVLNSANAFNAEAARALIEGLSDRQKQTGIQTVYLHTSGTSSIGLYPVPETPEERVVLHDTESIYDYLVQLEGKEPYAQRTTDVTVVDTGESVNVKTYIIMSPTIYGTGSGLFNRLTIQPPGIVQRGLRRGRVPVHGSGSGYWDYVHIDDLTQLYEIILSRVLSQGDIPFGKKGIYFSENGYFNWRKLSEGLAQAGQELGALETNEVEELSSDAWVSSPGSTPTAAKVQAGQLGFASWSRSTADLGRSLGWVPRHGPESWTESIKSTFQAVLDNTK
ncbi:NAD dependent epimerase/dehydratase family protein [Aaosphaeria arxii CBS 175.79]|uniref:NAD dependent epimerase/dehydratase family protein n=1 Tax=Aaosphaeria arxii CBS 175.79 TaxID=1450172 RepID=A0A6A5Y3A4_9PLEO|nr:NAD dependent epimerase/dehydratase family protein [Aaosphaeria arxii CBS 175.79]KAF2019507.1 NAD dependent epimerase/dehydratase family protein [Aaosphaeria arxii CBS 175.79]